MPPAPGISPKSDSGKRKIVSLVQNLTSQCKAISKPPPKTIPSIAAITGTLRLCNASNDFCARIHIINALSESASPISFKSPPAENTFSVPLIINTKLSLSIRTSSIA